MKPEVLKSWSLEIDYSRAPCLGADQKARGLWERDCLIKRYCNNLDIKVVFSSFQIGKLFSVKDPIPDGLRSRVVYKFACAGCNACYVGETTRYFSTRVREHLVTDKASHIFKHLQNSEHCRALCSLDCFHILDHASLSLY